MPTTETMPAAETMATTDQYEAFLQAYAPVQFRLMAYIRTLIHNRAAADDVFQETNLVLWRRFSEFRQDADFLQWALGISRKQVLKYWRSARRENHTFSEIFLERLTVEAFDNANKMDARQDALENCMRGLTERQHDLIYKFYGEGLSAETIANQWGRSVHAVYKCLAVLRRTLFNCVERYPAGGV